MTLSKKVSVRFVTYDGLPNLDPDDQLVLNELVGRGVTCDCAIWDDQSVDWKSASVTVVRSTWDYHLKVDRFRRWLSEMESSSRLVNPVDLIRWNMDKQYLRELSGKGINVVRTLWIDKTIAGASEFTLGDLLQEEQMVEAIIKPSIGLSTYNVHKVTGAKEDNDCLKSLLQSHSDLVLLQPFMKSVESYGERALVYINGQFSHAIRKQPFQSLAPAGLAGESLVNPTADEFRLAEQVLATLGVVPFARVDIVRDTDDMPCVMELELVEPSLYLSMYPSSVSVFADAIENELAAVSR